MVALRFVHMSYAISSTYVVSHAIAQGITTKSRTKSTTDLQRSDGPSPSLLTSFSHSPSFFQSFKENQTAYHSASLTKKLSPTAAVVDTLVWQGLASVVIPGLTINRLCASSRLLLNKYAVKVLSQQFRKWAVTGIGLASVPMIIHPIDW